MNSESSAKKRMEDNDLSSDSNGTLLNVWLTFYLKVELISKGDTISHSFTFLDDADDSPKGIKIKESVSKREVPDSKAEKEEGKGNKPGGW